jgi:DNA-binding MarR family transcriptional regulator
MSGPDYMPDSSSFASGPGPGQPADAESMAVAVVGRLFRLAPQLVDLLDLGAREYGLGFARGRVLWSLYESGPVLMRALSQALGISPRTVTGLIDGLEGDGWVTRAPHPSDRRATVIALTPVAERALVRLTATYRGLARDLLGDQDSGTLADALGIITTFEARLPGVVEAGLADYAANPPELPQQRTPAPNP